MARIAQSTPGQPAGNQSRISVQRYFEISLLLMLGTSFVTLATTGKLDVVSIVAVTGALLVKLSSYSREATFTLSPRIVTRLSIFYIVFYGLDFLIFAPGPGPLDRMLQATVHLILFTTVIKVFSARTYRDYGYLATLSFLMTLASAVLTVGTVFLVGFTLYLLFSISTFISYEIKRSAEGSVRAPEGPFASPHRNRSAMENALAALTLGLALGIAALAAVLFFVIPRYRSGYLTGLGMQAQNITGFSENVNLGDIRKILRSSVVVMRVKVEGNPRAFQGVKWRGVALTSFDGRHWYNDNTELHSISPFAFRQAHNQFALAAPQSWSKGRPRRLLEYRVLLSPLSTDVLFAAAVPREISGRFRLINLDETESLHNPQHNYSPLGYDVLSDAGFPSPEDLRTGSKDFPADIRLVYLNLPPLDPRISELALRVTSATANNYDRAVALQNYLRNNLVYNLDPPAIEPNDPIGSFLLRSKQGYCEYFAAAMVVMLRTMGIPSRVVNGFQTGSYNRIGKDFVVRARDAHSWVEVYFPDYGWISFDPTPADPNPVLPGAFDDYLDAASLFWNEWVVNYDFAHQIRLAAQVEQDSRQFQMDARRQFQHFQRYTVQLAYRIEGWLMSHKLLVLVLMLVALAGLVVVEKSLTLAELRFIWKWRFGRSGLALGPLESTLSYQQFLKAAQKKGYRKSPAQTPREFARALSSSHLGPPATEFTRLYNASRFGQSPVSYARLRTILNEIRAIRGV